MPAALPELNVFMMCETPSPSAFTNLSSEFHFRTCRKNELDIWMAMPFDDEETAQHYHHFMMEFYNAVYAAQEDLFFQKCTFVCNDRDQPIGTCFAWPAYNNVTTLHWWKVKKEYENRGIGRALLSYILRGIDQKDFPIFLHTQPESYRAIKLYSDFGFSFLVDEVIGLRKNHYKQSIALLKNLVPPDAFSKFSATSAPTYFLEAVASSPINQF